MNKNLITSLLNRVVITGMVLSLGFGGQIETQNSLIHVTGLRTLHFAMETVDQIPITENGVEWTRLSLPGGGLNSQPGEPELPAVTSWIAIDPTRHYTPEITLGEPEVLENIHLPIYQAEDDPEHFTSPRTTQPDLVTVSEPVVMRDLVMVQVTITPFRYHPEEATVDVYHSIDVELVDDGPSDLNTVTPPQLSKAFEPLYASLVANFDRDAFSDDYQQPSILYILPSNVSSVLPVIEPLFEWRKRSGFVVDYASVSEIGTSNTSIKNYIQNAYLNGENPPEFVVLVGDAAGSFSVATFHETWSWYNGEGDQPYAELVGTDHFPEVFIGRLSFSSVTELATIVNKTIQYESNPYMIGEDWFSRALLVGDPASSGISTIITNEYIKERMEFHGGSDIRTVYSAPFASQMVSNLNDGVGYFNYRGWLGVSGFGASDINSLTNGFMLPFATPITCGTGTFGSSYSVALTEALIRAGTPSQPKGAVCAIGTATTGTHTQFNNAVDMGIYYGLFDEGINFAGAALARGKLNLAQDYPANPENYVDIFTHWNNLMGDPALRVWKRFPQTMTVDHSFGISLGTNYFDIAVLDQHGVIEGAFVTLWKDDDNSLFKSAYTDENGRATIPLDSVTVGNVLVTVVKQDYKPYQGSFSVVALDKNVNILADAVVIDDDSTGLSFGNGDGIINGGEQVEIHVPFKNYGVLADTGLVAILTSTSSQISIIIDTVEIGILDSGAVGFSGLPFVVSANPGLDEGTPLGLRVEINDQDGNSWSGDLRLEAAGSQLELYELTVVDFSNHVLDPGETVGLQVTLFNHGSVPATGVNGVLMCSSPSININVENSTWNDLGPNELVNNSGNIFSLTADDDILPGSKFPCFLVVTTGEGNYHSFYFELTVGIPTEGDPLGPDEYGYYIYDSGDQMYNSVPNYDWIEIDNRLGGPGEDIILTDTGNNQDDIKVLSLPFPFTFYGTEYDLITVSSNGWIAMGETTLKSFRNYPLPGAGGPSPMIAAFWDDLTTSNGGKIFSYWDQTNHIFIIEWSGMRTYQQSSVEDFQVILRDPSYFLTPTGDGEILIQYKTFNNTSYNTGSATTHGNYCTVGIEDPSALIGLQYTFNNEYPAAAMPLSNETALLITTRGGSVRVYGDVNQDGELNVFDLLLLANYLDDGDPSYLSPFMADINSDGQVDLIDLIVMFQTILNEQ